MKISKIATGLVLVAAIPAIALAAKPAAKEAAKAIDWTSRVTLSPIGGHIMGNPAAGTRLVEYVSYTCVHCAHFTNENAGALKLGWVKGGKTSVEVRNAVRDRYDLTAALLARCGGKDRFFGNHAAIYANYDAWMKQIEAFEQNAPDPAGKDELAVMQEIADRTGLTDLMTQRGFTPDRQKTCLADKAAQQRILAMSKEAWETLKIGGTPSFSVNGKLLKDAHDWATLKPALPPVAG